ncbi:methionyl-tRNA formyltransferase [Odoribacter lunatus]|uniref:methionyl-tRNA formyltransferase n=1 Tax=Odoribacter lunatus TaxID=2941335 RepID=UPI002040A36D|nr:methionyl-tRNA formyltransferase [Odoribacter lunatus]
MQKHSLRIVYMGTPDFAVLPLKKIIEAGFEVVGVVTNPDKPSGRGQRIQESAVKKYAVEQGIPFLQPERFRDEGFLHELAAWKADLQLVVAFKMLPEVVWNMPPLGTVNLHASLLPDYRGAAPINWAIMNGETCTGVSTFLLSHEIDTGKIIFQEKVAIKEDMTAGDLHDILMEKGADLLVKTVEAIEQKQCLLIDQNHLLDGREPKLAPKIFKENRKIDWTADVETVYNHVRGLSPYPAAWTEIRHKVSGEIIQMKVVSVRMEKGETEKRPGEMYTDGKKRWEVIVSNGRIFLEEIQLAGRRCMKVSELLRGFKLDDYILS